jgi:hypothetical protein
MFEKFKKWWYGEDIVHKNKPTDPLIIIGLYNKKHWTSSLVHWFVSLFTNPERRPIFLAVLTFITFLIMLVSFINNTPPEQSLANKENSDKAIIAEK